MTREAEENLRSAAETQLEDLPQDRAPASSADLLHELQVHQIELEMQNETLRQTQNALEASRDRYVDLYELAPAAYLTLSAQGLIDDINLHGAALLGLQRTKLTHRPFARFVVAEDQHLWYAHLARVLAHADNLTCELALQRRDGSRVEVLLDSQRQANDAEPFVVRLVLTDISERKQAEAALRAQAGQLKALSRRVLQAQESERRRVAIELHDELGQSLTAIKINLQVRERIGGPSPAELKAENIAIVDNALQQVRRLALALRPSMLDDLGLLPALQWLCEQTEARNDLVVQFAAGALPSRLAPEIETACFRIVQESLTNIVRHAGVCRVSIDLRQEGDTLVIRIEDDGCGFDLAAMRRQTLAGASMGVAGMQERAALIGGRLVVESSPGCGCRVRLSCPLQLREESL
jgi:PAS domain S-box-containing protein